MTATLPAAVAAGLAPAAAAGLARTPAATPADTPPRRPHAAGAGANHPPRLRAPGLGWVPAVWRRAATWRTVLRFVLLGPLIGGAPYAIFIFPIPFAYALGAGPALVAGLLFAAWYHGAGRRPGAAWRTLMGALAGAGAAAVAAVPLVLAASKPAWFMVAVIAAHGVPAAVLLALMQRPARPPVPRPVETGAPPVRQ